MSKDLFASFFEESDRKSPLPTQYGTPIADTRRANPWADDGTSVWQNSNPAPTAIAAAAAADNDDDDFGDFEDASASSPSSAMKQSTPPARAESNNSRSYISSTDAPKTSKASNENRTPLSPKAPARSTPPVIRATSRPKDERIGQHPFAGHMDFLFDAGDDEYDAGADDLGDLATNPELAMAYSKRIIAEQEAALEKARVAQVREQNNPKSNQGPRTNVNTTLDKPSTKTAYVPRKDPNVLFDAEDVSEDDEDDFGGFEFGNESSGNAAAVTSQPAQAQTRTSMPTIDLLGLDDAPETVQPLAANEKSSAYYETKHVPQPAVANSTEIWSQRADPDDDNWDDFETAVPITPPSHSTPNAPALRQPQQQRSVSNKLPPSKDNSLPPTNIPPPAVLISLFPSLITEADSALFATMAKLDLKQRQMLLGHPASHQFLTGYLKHCRVMARIIAGRKLRWKRDQRLSQSMSIGPAVAGGKGGMKLTGLDKAENAKEEREVLDVLRLWQSQVGKVRTAVTNASAAPGMKKLPSVPDIAEQMSVKTLKAFEGGLTAAHACALCGLKREERVGKVDVGVDDSFGEWWVEGMSMHLACRDFWAEFERKLKSR